MRNTILQFISHSIILLIYKQIPTTYENMRNENEKSFAGELEFNERLFFRKEQKRKR